MVVVRELVECERLLVTESKMALHCDTVPFAEPSLPGAFVSGTASEPLLESDDAMQVRSAFPSQILLLSVAIKSSRRGGVWLCRRAVCRVGGGGESCRLQVARRE